MLHWQAWRDLPTILAKHQETTLFLITRVGFRSLREQAINIQLISGSHVYAAIRNRRNRELNSWTRGISSFWRLAAVVEFAGHVRGIVGVQDRRSAGSP